MIIFLFVPLAPVENPSKVPPEAFAEKVYEFALAVFVALKINRNEEPTFKFG